MAPPPRSLIVAEVTVVAFATFASSDPARDDPAGARAPPTRRTTVSLCGDVLRFNVAMQIERRRS